MTASADRIGAARLTCDGLRCGLTRIEADMRRARNRIRRLQADLQDVPATPAP